jgi:hypothetical protein
MTARSNMWQKRGRTDDQRCSKGRVSGPRYAPMPLSAARGMIPWCQANPGGEVSTGFEHFRRRGFHAEHGRPDWSNARDRRKTSTDVILAVPFHQLSLDLLEAGFNRGIFPRLKRAPAPFPAACLPRAPS